MDFGQTLLRRIRILKIVDMLKDGLAGIVRSWYDRIGLCKRHKPPFNIGRQSCRLHFLVPFLIH